LIVAKRTIAEAREALDQLTLSPQQRRDYERHLTKLVNREVARVHQRQLHSYQTLDEEIGGLKAALSEVETQLYDLEKESRGRDLAAAEYRQRFGDLRARRNRLLDRATSLQTQVDKLTEVDEDPEGHLDSLYQRYPTIRPEWPW
jgi:chromosome segregation ATPase